VQLIGFRFVDSIAWIELRLERNGKQQQRQPNQRERAWHASTAHPRAHLTDEAAALFDARSLDRVLRLVIGGQLYCFAPPVVAIVWCWGVGGSRF